tara:strand:- start:3984 stop:4700 length:717 start_codon:yes stop_codon:yes gene_type:complete
MENPYDDSNLVPLGESLNSIDTGKVESELQKIIEEDVCGLSWNDWVECVQWLSVRFTKGEDAPSEWSETYIKAMFADLQYYTFDNIQKALIKLHSEGRSYAPNSSQIIGMCNKLGYAQVLSRAQADRAAKGQYSECKGGAQHDFQDWGWEFDEVGNPIFIEWCLNVYNINTPPCYAERVKSDSALNQYQKNIRPEPMTRERFIFTMDKLMKLPKEQQDVLLQYRNRLQSEKDLKGEEE